MTPVCFQLEPRGFFSGELAPATTIQFGGDAHRVASRPFHSVVPQRRRYDRRHRHIPVRRRGGAQPSRGGGGASSTLALNSTRAFKLLIVKNDDSAFNLKPGCLSLRHYTEVGFDASHTEALRPVGIPAVSRCAG